MEAKNSNTPRWVMTDGKVVDTTLNHEVYGKGSDGNSGIG